MNCKVNKILFDDSEAPVLNINSGNNQYVSKRERPGITYGYTVKFKTACCSLYIQVNHDEKGLLEVFLNLGKGGGCIAQSEAIGRLVSSMSSL